MSAVETITSAPPAVENPFKFLDYYAETDKSYFGGRDAEIREVTAGIMKHPTFVLYGRSGLGKTSLLLAGVFPELRSCRYSPVHVRLLQNPVEDLRAAVRDTLGQPCDADHPEPLDALIRRAAASAPVVLALDQFEEFFIRFRDEPELQHQFAESLGHLLRDHNLPVRVVFSIREDYIAELDDLRAELPDLLGHSYRLHPLSPFGARQAMVKTLMTAQVDYETRLITSLVEMIVADGRLEPTVLQIVCYEMYAHAAKRPERPVRLTEADLKQVGGLDGIFRRYLEDVIKQIDPASLLLARAVLDSLITSERTKRAVTLADLLAAGFEAKAEEISAMIDALVKARVIRGDTRGLQMWYELAHERLVRPLLDWFALDDDYSSFRRVRSLIADNSRDELWRKNVGLLLTKGAVALAGKYRLRLKLDPLQSEFVLWGAILHLSPDLSHWRGACGDDVTARALQIMLAMAGGDTRGAAA